MHSPIKLTEQTAATAAMKIRHGNICQKLREDMITTFKEAQRNTNNIETIKLLKLLVNQTSLIICTLYFCQVLDEEVPAASFSLAFRMGDLYL